MTKLLQRMREEWQLRNSSEETITTYLGCVERFARYYGQSPEQLNAEQVRSYLLYLLGERKLSWPALHVNRAALRFLSVRVLKQRWFDEEIPCPKRPLSLPTVLSADEITRILEHTRNLKHWTMLATLYATGLRSKELRLLKVRPGSPRRRNLCRQKRHSEPSPAHFAQLPEARSPGWRPPPDPAAGYRSAFPRERKAWRPSPRPLEAPLTAPLRLSKAEADATYEHQRNRVGEAVLVLGMNLPVGENLLPDSTSDRMDLFQTRVGPGGEKGRVNVYKQKQDWTAFVSKDGRGSRRAWPLG